MTQERYLVIANAYPDDSNIYSYGFLHRRVKKYLAAGLGIDVFRISADETKLRTYVFEGVTVFTGNRDIYAEYIIASSHASYLIHFPLNYIVDPVTRHKPTIPIIAWLHGYETLSWHRRWYDAVRTPAFMDKLKSLHAHTVHHKVPFLQRIYEAKDLNIRFVTVSRWFLKHCVEPDAGTTVKNISIIPNVIDDELFPYVVKEPDQRYKVLVIRPFTGHKYANDLAVKAILIFRNSKHFQKTHFSIYGDGPDFDAILEPLRGLENVHITKSFLPQNEIASVHAEHGIFLAPTRQDSQGVSIGEAMSSGLVPISTATWAIPEFVEHGKSGLLADPESPEGLASCLELLIGSPETFSRMSEEATRQAQEICGPQSTIDREIQLIRNPELGRNNGIGEISWDLAYADLENELLAILNFMSEQMFATDGLESDSVND